jgi:predicted nucleotidyltransferase
MDNTILTLETIKERIAPLAEKHGIAAVYVFGSYARGEATGMSDVDLCIDDGKIKTLFELGGFYADVEQTLEKPLDLVTVAAMQQPTQSRVQKKFRQQVQREKVKIYG